MKNAKIFKFIALMLALVMCLSLCACGGGQQDDDYAGLGGLDVGGAQGGSGNGGSNNGDSIDTGFETEVVAANVGKPTITVGGSGASDL